jgi:hypothetical protein
VNVNGRKTLSGVLLIAAHEIMEIAWCKRTCIFFTVELYSQFMRILHGVSKVLPFLASFKILKTLYQSVYNNKLISKSKYPIYIMELFNNIYILISKNAMLLWIYSLFFII